MDSHPATNFGSDPSSLSRGRKYEVVMAEKLNITLLPFLFGRAVLITQSCLSTFGKLAGKGLPTHTHKHFGVLMIPNQIVKVIG